MSARILVIDDEPNITSSFSALLKDEGYDPVVASSAEEATRLCARQQFDLILLDLQLPGRSGMEFLRDLRKEIWHPEVMVISGQADIPTALEAVRLGAVDFLEKPVPAEKLIATVGSCLALAVANKQRRLNLDEIDDASRLVGDTAAMKGLLNTIRQVAPSDTTVLIRGDNGTGKELVATRLYLESNRKDGPFIKVNCPGIPESLFESELFGHMKGSFTGAVRDYPGKFVLADGGTIFLDEIGDLPLTCQAKLLRAIETGEIETIGSETPRRVDVRIICASNRNLPALVSEQRFREDLYYRISVFEVTVPALAERLEDIPLLVGRFLKRFDKTGNTCLTPAGMAYLTTLDWPGNVRQLKNLVERLTILHAGERIDIPHLEQQVGGSHAENSAQETDSSLSDRLDAYERRIIEQTLQNVGGNITQAADRLKVDRSQLSRKIKELGLRDQ
jgi:two-component system nitrogen regulation response regulator NtrX